MPDAATVHSDAESHMKKAVEALKRELNTIRTGRASAALLDRLMVDYYNTPTPVEQVAKISVPEPRTLTISPWDRNMLGPIEKAIQKSDLGINPTNDGKLIRLSLPPLTTERRKEMVKLVHKKTEEGRVAVRNVRRDALDRLNKLEKDKTISADEHKRALDRLQKLTDNYIAEVDRVGNAKEHEVTEV